MAEWFAKRGYDCWCVDMEGYRRSTKDRDDNAPISSVPTTATLPRRCFNAPPNHRGHVFRRRAGR